jgi:hypothetical protein
MHPRPIHLTVGAILVIFYLANIQHSAIDDPASAAGPTVNRNSQGWPKIWDNFTHLILIFGKKCWANLQNLGPVNFALPGGTWSLRSSARAGARPASVSVQYLPGRLSAPSIFHSKLVLYGAFVWERRPLNIPKRRFPPRAVAGFKNLSEERRRAIEARASGVIKSLAAADAGT